ncbi:MAG: helix-turn-helix domain-containing protein [Thermacetogeniaceae bacterium]|jgi:excisionase family DNA binding protein
MKGTIVITLGDKQVFNIGFSIDTEELHKLIESPYFPAEKIIEQGQLKDAYSVREAAEKLGVSKDTVYDQVKAKTIPFRKLGGRVVIPKAALEKWLTEANQVNTSAE